MEYKVRILLGTYMSFLDDSQTPNVFGWACWFVLGKPATTHAAIPPHPYLHRHPFLPSTCHLPSTHRPPTIHPPCHLPRRAPTVLESEVVPATMFRLAGAYNGLLDGKRISSYGVNDPSIYIFYRCPRHLSWRHM